MPSLAELLGYLVQPMGGPGFPMLPKSPSNATAGSIPAVPGPRGQPLSSPAEMMAALTGIRNAGTAEGSAKYENKLREAQAASLLKTAENDAALLKGLQEIYGLVGSQGGASGTGGAPAPLSLDGGSGGAAPAGTGGISRGDPVEHFLDLANQHESGNRNIKQQVVGPNGGYNPSVGRVTGPSSAQGYFQIINPTWREFAPAAGVDLEQYPNAMSAPYEVQRQVARTIATTSGVQHWTDFNKSLRAAAERAGLPVSGPVAGSRGGSSQLAENTLPAVPNFGGMMAGNMGPTYAPPMLEGADGALAAANASQFGALSPGGGINVVPLAGETPGIPGQAPAHGLTPLELALGKLGGISMLTRKNDITAPLRDMLRHSPEYITRAEAAKLRAQLGFADPIERAKTKAQRDITEPSDIRIAKAVEAAKTPEIMARDRFKAQLDALQQANRVVELQPGAVADINPNRFPFPQVPGAPPSDTAGTPQAAAPGIVLRGADPAERRFGDEVAQQNAKEFFVRRKEAQDAGALMQSSQRARSLLDSGVITGVGANWLLNVSRALSQAGLSNGESVANTQAFVAERATAVGKMISALGSGTAISDADREFTTKAAGGDITMDEKSIRRILKINDEVAREFISKFNADAAKVDPKLSPYPLTVPMPTVPGRSGVTSGGVRWSRD